MHVAIVGMGALGRVYGVRLASRSDAAVTFVVRSARPGLPLRVTRIDGDGATDELAQPVVETRIPPNADIVLVCVRVEQLDGDLDRLLGGASGIPIVVLTPLFPHDFGRLTREHGARVLAAMPGVVAYVTPDGGCRYWLPRVAPTLIDETPPVPEAARRLVEVLAAAGMPARLEPGVRDTNPATTLSFIPLTMGIDAAGSVDALLADRGLLRLALDALGEARVLAARVGKTPAWVAPLVSFASPTTLRMGVGLVRSRWPETLRYVDDHFGRKLHAQNLAMAKAIIDLSSESGTPCQALLRLRARLESVGV